MQLGIRSIVCLVFFALIVSGADVPPCDLPIVITQVEGVEAHAGEYFGLRVSVPVKAVIIRDSSGLPPEDLPLDPMAGDYWAINVPAPRIPLKLPLTVILVSPSDEGLKLFGIITEWHDNQEINTHQCFGQQPPPPPCPQTITLRQAPGVGPLYFGLFVFGATEEIIKVEVQGQKMKAMDPSWWMDMPPMAGGYWAVNSPVEMVLPFSIQLTSIKGHVLVFPDVITEWKAGAEVHTDMCFEIARPPPEICHDQGPCQPAITLRQADGVSPNYFGLYVFCADEKIAHVRIKDPTMAYWLNMPEMAGDPGPNYWAVNVNAPRYLRLPLQVQLITVSGHVLNLNRKIYGFFPNRYVDTEECFNPLPPA